jgi:small multidrug resistance pump
MGWLFLVLAILLEVSATTCMNLSESFTKMLPSVLMFILYGFCFASFTLALEKIDLSIAYAIWCDIGMALIVAIGILWFKEPITALKMLSIGFILIGTVGLSLAESR